MFRICVTCQLQGNPAKQATHVATSPGDQHWLECADHEAHEHAEALGCKDDPNAQRCELLSREQWVERARLQQTPSFEPAAVVAVEPAAAEEEGDPDDTGPDLGEDDEDALPEGYPYGH